MASSTIILAFVFLHIPLTHLSGCTPYLQEIIVVEMNIFWWLVLLFNCVLLLRQRIGGLYFVTFFYGTSLLTLILSTVESVTLQETSVRSHANVETDPDDQNETTPLLLRVQPRTSKIDYLFWSLKFLLCVLIPVVLMTQIGVILLNALSQTLSDGSSASFGKRTLHLSRICVHSVDILIVYSMIALVSFLLVLPIVPFMLKIHRNVSFALLGLFVLIFAFNLLSSPFLEESPLKVFFHQAVNLTDRTNTVHLASIESYLQEIVHQIPSTAFQTVTCERTGSGRSGLMTCEWNSITALTKDSVSVKTDVIQPGKAVFRLRGEDTRVCRIRFDAPILAFYVHGTTGEIQPGYPLPPSGIRELNLWSRERGKEFIVDVSWPVNEVLRGRVSCGWSDSEDWETRIPAFKEVLDFLPSWSVVNDFENELVEASLEFSV